MNTHDMSEQSVGGQAPQDEGFASNRNNIFNLITDSSTPDVSDPALNDATMSNTSNHSQDRRQLPEAIQSPDSRSAAASRLLSRRQSTMSRLGTRILPNSVIRGLLSSEEETPAEGHAHRNGRILRPLPRTEVLHSTSRFSPFSSMGSRGISRRRSIRGPYPLPRGDAALIPDSPPNPTYVNPAVDSVAASDRGWRRSPRLNRVRNSLSTPISHIFGAAPTLPDPEEMRVPPQRPLRSSVGDVDQLLPPLEPMDIHMDLDDGTQPDFSQQSGNDTQSLSSLPHPRSLQGQGPGPIRRLPGILRARSSRVPRRDEPTPLSRVLQVAAAAIAAQLSGSTAPTLPNIQSLGNEGFDASLESLFQSLQQATSAQDNPPGSSSGQNSPQPGTPTPLNFLRVFRFANSDSPGGRNANGGQHTSQASEQMDMEDGGEEGSENRTVTLVVVGVRSVPSNGPLGNPQTTGGIGLDTLLGLPNIPPMSGNTSQERGSIGNALQNNEGTSRVPTSRINNGGVNSSPDNPSSSHPRPSSSINRNPLDPTSPALPAVLADSPPGPYPPPSTPAEIPMSSGHSTPSRRPSSASAMSPNVLPQVHEEPTQDSMLQSETYPPIAGSGSRQRRRSDSEFARHRHLGSGAARRQGVVEPDQPTPSTGRTWVIYVVGTNLSENHPAFATPSLFTDVCHSPRLLMQSVALYSR